LWGYDINGEEYSDFGDEMLQRPIQPCFPDTFKYNPAGPFADFYMAGLKKSLEVYDFDGIYFDGLPVLKPFFDPLLGEGYIDANGNKHGKWAFWALRDWSRRYYAIMKQRNGIVYQHTSGSLPNMAILSFADFVCGGEESPCQEKMLDCWSLDEYFVKCYQRPYGIGYHTLWYDWWKRPVKENQVLAATLLYGQLLNFYGGHLSKYNMDKVSYDKQPAPAIALMHILRDFKPSNAQWIPFWKSASFISSEPASLKSSLYLYPQEKALIIVSNLEEKAVNASIKLNLEKMGFRNSPVKIFDPILKSPVEIKNGFINLNMEGERYRILLLDRKQ
jgi:hypothetical protein